MHLSNNTLLQGGKYKIIRFIASGGFGCTYEAEHVLLKKRVAIKEFFVKDFCNRDETTAHITVATQSKVGLVIKLRHKFMEEAQVLSNFQHPGIVHVTDIFEDNGTAYYVMDFIEGESLNEKVKRQGPLSESLALKYIHQVADALAYVHDHHCLHLDIKPGNIIIDNHDQAILIDFGASKQYDEENGENTSTLMGQTPGYAPLEQMGNNVSHFLPATDIYGLGATMYKLLTGNTPPAANQLALGEESLNIPSTISVKARETIKNAMRIKKSERFQSVSDFLKMLPLQEETLKKNTQSNSPENDDDQNITDTTFNFRNPSNEIKSKMNDFVSIDNADRVSGITGEEKYSSKWKTITVAVIVFICLFFFISRGCSSSSELSSAAESSRDMDINIGTNRSVANNTYSDPLSPIDLDKNKSDNQESNSDKERETIDNAIVEVQAGYPGGEAALLQFIGENLIYPEIAIERELQGNVILKFKVDVDGSIGTIKIVKSLSPECDLAAISVIKKLKRFIPAKQHGHPVAVWFTLPIRFRLI